MKTPVKKRPPPPASIPRGAPLPPQEQTELHRQGAKAAVRGDEATTNPMDQARNAPASTGESPQTWSQRRDAWQAGYEAQTKIPTEPTTNPKGVPDDGGD